MLYTAGALLLLVGAGPAPQYLARWLPAQLLTGLGVALIIPLLSSVAVRGLPAGRLASGSGVFQALRQFASVLGVALSVLLLGPTAGNAAAFAPIFALMAAAGLGVSLICLGLPASRRPIPRPESVSAG